MTKLHYSISMKIIKIFLITTLLLTSVSANAVDPKLKVMGTMCVYGTVGGFLLGTASLAFGGEERNIFKGASLGLYAGIVFGGYVILSHMARKNNWGGGDVGGDYYPETASPYEVQKWNATIDRPKHLIDNKQAPLFYMNVLKLKF